MRLPGQGHFTWVDGRSYEGAYNNDQKDGFGTSGASGSGPEGDLVSHPRLVGG
jgi:hypothetical protein